ncbi:MAG TPA: cation:proton antiporter regulatory subunit [Actinomycetes bacterium]|nr:cation:proton antiporter regulatory subunit [Actinomycetes bacterium]
MDVVETLLPGVGRRYEFELEDGMRLCIVSTRDDHYIVSTFDRNDPDVGRTLFELDEDEAVTMAEILGAPRIAVKLADLTREIPGLASEQIEIARGSRFDGKTLGDTQMRTRTGSSVVALVRDDVVLASPEPSQDLVGGDVLVVIGTDEGISKARAILEAQ